MELYEGLISRRSVRKYTGEKIDEERIINIIRAGMYAPSARNRRPWHFVVIDSPQVMKSIMNAHPHASMLADASHAIVVCGDETLENGPGYWRLDCSAASQNILLAAHAMGLGAVWLGVEPRKERSDAIAKIIGLPGHVHPLAVISLGIPVSIPEEIPARFEKEKIRRNRW